MENDHIAGNKPVSPEVGPDHSILGFTQHAGYKRCVRGYANVSDLVAPMRFQLFFKLFPIHTANQEGIMRADKGGKAKKRLMAMKGVIDDFHRLERIFPMLLISFLGAIAGLVVLSLYKKTRDSKREE